MSTTPQTLTLTGTNTWQAKPGFKIKSILVDNRSNGWLRLSPSTTPITDPNVTGQIIVLATTAPSLDFELTSTPPPDQIAGLPNAGVCTIQVTDQELPPSSGIVANNLPMVQNEVLLLDTGNQTIPKVYTIPISPFIHTINMILAGVSGGALPTIEIQGNVTGQVYFLASNLGIGQEQPVNISSAIDTSVTLTISSVNAKQYRLFVMGEPYAWPNSLHQFVEAFGVDGTGVPRPLLTDATGALVTTTGAGGNVFKELAAATATANQSVTATATPGTDLTGLTVTVTPDGTHPVYIEFDLPSINPTGGNVFVVAIQKDGAVVDTFEPGGTAGLYTMHHRYRDPAPTNASHTYKLSAWSGFAQTVTFLMNATQIGLITATQVQN